MGVSLNVMEWMKGYVGFGATDTDAGFVEGIEQGTYFEHEVLIQIADIDAFVDKPDHTARMDGHVYCERLGGKLPFQGGMFNMLVADDNPSLYFMFYRMPLENAAGQRFTMLGHKTLHRDRSLDLWSDITTLAVRIFEGDVAGPDMTTPALGAAPDWPAAPIAMGIIHIQVLDGFRSARSFRSPGSSPLELAGAVKKFCGFYLDRLWDVYARVHRSPDVPDVPDVPERAPGAPAPHGELESLRASNA
jgi:hypothetical protein